MTLQEALPLIIALITVIVCVATFYIGRSSANKDEGKQEGQILSELGYVKSGVDDLKHKIDKQDEKFANIYERLAKVEASAKQAHHRLDSIEQRCCGE